jgi:hypothetical protein
MRQFKSTADVYREQQDRYYNTISLAKKRASQMQIEPVTLKEKRDPEELHKFHQIQKALRSSPMLT